VFDCASNYNQQGIANFIAGAIEGQQFYKWQLTASLGEEVTESAVDPVDVVGMDADDVSMSMPSMELVAAYSAEIDSLVIRAMADSVKVGSFVSWNNGTARARGKVEKVVTTGTATSSDGFTMDANADKPVFVIRIYSSKGNGYVETDTTVLHFADVLTVTDDLPSPRNENIDMESRKSRMASAERVTMDCEVRAIATDSTSLRIGGYAAQFNKEATGLSFREVIAPGAFTRTLQSGEPVFLLVNHDTDNLPLASTQSGTMELRQDETGLYMEADLDPNNPRAQELASAVSRGDVSKMSFAFTVEPGGDTREAGLRTLQDLNLFEVSVVTWPAYDATTVGMRTASAEDAEAEALELRKRMLDLKQKFSNSKNR
jgi:HK97 family phage prohead protease